MAFKDFSDIKYIKTVDTSETINMGSFSTDANLELGHIRALIYIQGTLGGSEQIRLSIYPTEDSTNATYTSSWSNVGDVLDENGEAVTGNWLGLIRCDFDRENINNNLTYYLKAELQNYTRNSQTFYIGFAYDYPNIIYDNSEDELQDHPLAFEIYGYAERV